MTKEITKAIILQELENRFNLREYEPSKFLFDETVVPTYDIGNHVKYWKTERERKQVSVDGSQTFFTVPDDEIWHIRKIDIMNETGGNFDIDQIFLYESATEVQYLFYDTTTPIAPGTVKMFSLPQDIVMQKGHLTMVYVHVSNFVAGGWVAAHMFREVETIR